MEFCPTCGTFLQFEFPQMGQPSRFSCPVCPYVYNLEGKVKIKKKLRMDKNKPAIESQVCPSCQGGKIESYIRQEGSDGRVLKDCKCWNCQHTWTEN